MNDFFCDALIVGGGPAGYMAAIGAKQSNPNLNVVLLERHEQPKHKIGEALLTGTIIALDQAGLTERIASEGFHRKIGAAYVWGESAEPWYVNYPLDSDMPYPEQFRDHERRYSIHVPRHKFDAVLKDEAIKRGVTIIYEQGEFITARNPMVKPPRHDITVISVQTPIRKIRAGYYIDATGQAAVMAKSVGMRTRIGSSRVGKYCYLADIDWENARDNGFDIHRTNILSNEHGWMWVIHLGEAGDNLTSVGFISTPDLVSKLEFGNITQYFPELGKFGIKDLSPKDVYGKPLSKWYAQPDYSYKSEALHGKNWALAGDASMFIDPILSQGVTLATHYGLLRGRAVAAALEGDARRQYDVSHHYKCEGIVLQEVIRQWYGSNRIAGDWKLHAAMLAETVYSEKKDSDDAFRYITNLENIRKEYWPYPMSEQREIDARLGASTLVS